MLGAASQARRPGFADCEHSILVTTRQNPLATFVTAIQSFAPDMCLAAI